jgi:hypothetical protein
MTAATGTTPPASPPGAPTAEPVIKPSGVWYWVGGLTMALGSIAAIVWFSLSVATLVNLPDTYQRIPVPGEDTVRLQAGENTLFTEIDRYSSFAYVVPDDPEVTITGPTGTELTVVPEYRGTSRSGSRSSSSGSSYTRDDRRGVSFATVQVPSTDLYTVTTREPVIRDSPGSAFPSTAADEDVELAIGDDLDEAALAGVFASMGLGFVTFVAGAIVMI